MKNFFTSMLGAFVALIVFTGGCVVLFMAFLAALATLGGGDKGSGNFERGSYLVFNLSSNISDAPAAVS